MDIGVYWSPAVLEHKLERHEQRGHPQEVWNCRHLHKGLGVDPSGDRLVVGCHRRWIGAFRLIPEVLYIPTDPVCPYALIFDVKTWTLFPTPIPCRPFRGWTYLTDPTSSMPPSHSDSAAPAPPSTGNPHLRR